MYQKLFKGVLFPLYETVVRRRGTPAYMREYQASQWLKFEEIERIQLDKLNRLLRHAWAEVPFLRAYWSRAGLVPGDLASLTELERYPVLTKDLVTANYGDMIASSWRGKTMRKTTGGSSGEPFSLEYTMESYARRTAVMWRGYAWSGADLGVRTAYIWGTGQRKGGWGGLKDQLYHGAFNRCFLDAFALTEQNISEYVKGIQKFRAKILVGYVAPVTLVARWINNNGVRIAGIDAVLTGAEALYESERAEIERAFGCKVFNTYGCREFMLLAAECDQHRGLHVSADHLVLETLDEQGRPVKGVSGDVIVTDLHNYGMPMVRYRNGDRATYNPDSCSCGRGLPILSSVDGRILDTIVTPDGRLVPGEFFVAVMIGFPSIEKYLIVQTAPDEIQVQIAPKGRITHAECEQLRRAMIAGVGDATRLVVDERDSIPPSRSGKRRVTVSYTSAN